MIHGTYQASIVEEGGYVLVGSPQPYQYCSKYFSRMLTIHFSTVCAS